MKIKLVKVKTLSETIAFNYGDDYSDVTRHIVENYSDFEEVTIFDLDKIREWVRQYNLQGKGEYILLVENEIITVKSVLDDIIRVENERMEKRKEQDRKDQERREQEKQNRAAKKLEKLKKQLAKAEKEAGIEKSVENSENRKTWAQAQN